MTDITTRTDDELATTMMQENEVCYHGSMDGVCPREDGCTAPTPCGKEVMVRVLDELLRRAKQREADLATERKVSAWLAGMCAAKCLAQDLSIETWDRGYWLGAARTAVNKEAS